MNFAKNLKKTRKRHKISQVKLAKETGLTRSMIASYEQGIAEPTFCNLLKIAAYFNVTTDYLIKK